VVRQRFPPVVGVDTRCGEVVLVESPVGHCVEQVVLAAKVPVDAGDADVEVFGQLRHAEVVDRHLGRDAEGACEDLLDTDGPAFTTLSFRAGGGSRHQCPLEASGDRIEGDGYGGGRPERLTEDVGILAGVELEIGDPVE
jgi:hypothetical protein